MIDPKNLKIAYIGGGSRGWAWELMSDLALESDISGTVHLYDIDKKAAKTNELIGNKMSTLENAKSKWAYRAIDKIDDALSGMDFVVISILPGTFDEMESDVHYPENFGIYQPVGDTTGPGGIVRAMRTVPMFVEIANAIAKNCPDAWVINYTNPMAICINTLYKTFPKIKAFGCCHEVFSAQKLLAHALDVVLGIKDVKRQEIKTNVTGVNHFTWLTKASYRDIDLFPVYEKYCEMFHATGDVDVEKGHWMNSTFADGRRIKMDLFRKFGLIAAAGDRHLAEFCPKSWYLNDLDTIANWQFHLTTVKWRRENLLERLGRAARLESGEEVFEMKPSGEEGVLQIKAILGLGDFVTNVNLPNNGQIEDLPKGVVVETNCLFAKNTVAPVMTGKLPPAIAPFIARNAYNQEAITNASINKDKKLAFSAFASDPLVEGLTYDALSEMFDAMVDNTKKYIAGW